MDIDDVLYQSPAGPITVRDVIYGSGVEVERSGNEFFAHKTGFSEKSLINILKQSGFPIVLTGTGNFEMVAMAFKSEPSDYVKGLFGLAIP